MSDTLAMLWIVKSRLNSLNQQSERLRSTNMAMT